MVVNFYGITGMSLEHGAFAPFQKATQTFSPFSWFSDASFIACTSSPSRISCFFTSALILYLSSVTTKSFILHSQKIYLDVWIEKNPCESQSNVLKYKISCVYNFIDQFFFLPAKKKLILLDLVTSNSQI